MISPLRVSGTHCLLDIRLTPNAAQNRIEDVFMDGDGRPRLKVKVTVVPEKGKANKALIKLLSKSFKRPPSAFKILMGKLDRNKTVSISGNLPVTDDDIKAWQKKLQPLTSLGDDEI
ncbi:MAG: hypothetical protein COB93_07150 [Sneathiella sp.]|nr:MAG: hypothetical protein COB93_07150 [Sneathiella sp.]